jgi:general stress protein 26
MTQEAKGTSAANLDTIPHLVSLLRTFDNACLVTRQRTGTLRSRPMAIARVDADATVWFFTSKGSPKVTELASDERSLIAFQSATRFASLFGICEVSSDQGLIDELWKESYRAWYDDNHDPEIALLRFTPYEAEFWDNSGVKGLRYILLAAKAYMSGQTLADRMGGGEDSGAHAKVKL